MANEKPQLTGATPPGGLKLVEVTSPLQVKRDGNNVTLLVPSAKTGLAANGG